ncbi:(2Fe-2S)-binding protein [Streptomyces sp. NPDC050658]|uniref:(2Fe-2S)-binding protein n=1 Tax=unclassified Streptomyces TaxID=2593676 RepID=UPI003416D654
MTEAAGTPGWRDAPARRRNVTMTVNGKPATAPAEDRTLLSDYLRHGLLLTGTHVGCEQGVCGACTVLVDDIPVPSCLMLAVQAEGSSVRTVESLTGDDGDLSGMQRALLESHGLQCGFCTPGLLMSLAHAEEQELTGHEIAEDVLPGHLCRCTGYAGIRAAVERYWAAGGKGKGRHE